MEYKDLKKIIHNSSNEKAHQLSTQDNNMIRPATPQQRPNEMKPICIPQGQIRPAKQEVRPMLRYQKPLISANLHVEHVQSSYTEAELDAILGDIGVRLSRTIQLHRSRIGCNTERYWRETIRTDTQHDGD